MSKYYLIYTQGQDSGFDGPYSETDIREAYIDCLGGMSVGIGKKNKKGDITFISEKEHRDIVKFSKELEQEYISACMVVNSLYGKIRQQVC